MSSETCSPSPGLATRIWEKLMSSMMESKTGPPSLVRSSLMIAAVPLAPGTLPSEAYMNSGTALAPLDSTSSISAST